jgi:DNA-binding transcriptional MerR regulator
MQEDGIRRLYYSIADVSKLTGLEPHVLRYWETEFPELAPRKNRAGHRIYMEQDVRMVMRIRALLKEDKYTIEGARQILERGDVDLVSIRKEELRQMRDLLSTFLRTLEARPATQPRE